MTSFHPHNDDFISLLKDSKTPMDPGFSARLKQNLVLEMEKTHSSKSWPTFILNFFAMKKFAYSALATFLMVAIVGGTYYQFEVKNNPSRIIDSALAYYESSANYGEIYHQKTWTQDSWNCTEESCGEVFETWEDGQGNFLSIMKDYKTDAIYDVFLNKVAENGQIKNYILSSLDLNTTSDFMVIQGEDSSYVSLDSGNYCLETVGDETHSGEVIIQISKEDPTYYSISGGWQSNPTEEESKLTQLSDPSLSMESAMTLLKDLKTNPSLAYQSMEENDVSYDVFTDANDEISFWNPKSFTFSYYFNADSHALEKTVYTTEVDGIPNIVTTFFLISEYVD
ncbi:MAG: hypothetical protein WCW30_04705, partial [Candidatus Gracilibacteria bacterium]